MPRNDRPISPTNPNNVNLTNYSNPWSSFERERPLAPQLDPRVEALQRIYMMNQAGVNPLQKQSISQMTPADMLAMGFPSGGAYATNMTNGRPNYLDVPNGEYGAESRQDYYTPQQSMVSPREEALQSAVESTNQLPTTDVGGLTGLPVPPKSNTYIADLEKPHGAKGYEDDEEVGEEKTSTSKKEAGDFALYSPSKGRSALSAPEKRELRDQEGAAMEFLANIERAKEKIRTKGIAVNPLGQDYRDFEAFDRGFIETGRKINKSGANFTEMEMDNIRKQIGPFYGVGAAIKGKREAIERLELAEELFMTRVNSSFKAAGLEPRRVKVKGPNGAAVEVYAYEEPRVKRLAKDKDEWESFIEELRANEQA